MNNIYKSWISSIFGIMLWVFSLVAFWNDKLDWWHLVVILFVGLYFLFSDDDDPAQFAKNIIFRIFPTPPK